MPRRVRGRASRVGRPQGSRRRRNARKVEIKGESITKEVVSPRGIWVKERKAKAMPRKPRVPRRSRIFRVFGQGGKTVERERPTGERWRRRREERDWIRPRKKTSWKEEVKAYFWGV